MRPQQGIGRRMQPSRRRRRPAAAGQPKRSKLRPRHLVLAVILCFASAAAGRWLRTQPAFLVETIRLVDVPEALEPAVKAQVKPWVGLSVFTLWRHRAVLPERVEQAPEVLQAWVELAWPNTVNVRVEPRVPVLAVASGEGWLSVDATGYIVRCVGEPEPELTQITGLPSAVAEPGASLRSEAVAQATECVAACERVLGEPPASISFRQGGLEVVTRAGDLIILGLARDLDRKLQLFQVVRNRVDQPLAYVDVAMPGVPAWLPADG